MQDRFKFRYVFTKDFGGKTGICYKMPIFNLDTITDENFNKIVKSYIDYDYKLISIKQSTGLKDKNGKLIYEGDIVQTTFENNSKRIFSVVWDNKTALFNGKIIKKEGINNYFMPNRDYLYYLLGNEKDEVEVIGNIYENPELIKGEQ